MSQLNAQNQYIVILNTNMIKIMKLPIISTEVHLHQEVECGNQRKQRKLISIIPLITCHQSEPMSHQLETTWHEAEPVSHKIKTMWHEDEPVFHKVKTTRHQSEPMFPQIETTSHQSELLSHQIEIW